MENEYSYRCNRQVWIKNLQVDKFEDLYNRLVYLL